MKSNDIFWTRDHLIDQGIGSFDLCGAYPSIPFTPYDSEKFSSPKNDKHNLLDWAVRCFDITNAIQT